jgi:hypothetical protein
VKVGDLLKWRDYCYPELTDLGIVTKMDSIDTSVVWSRDGDCLHNRLDLEERMATGEVEILNESR